MDSYANQDAAPQDSETSGKEIGSAATLPPLASRRVLRNGVQHGKLSSMLMGGTCKVAARHGGTVRQPLLKKLS